MQILQMLKIALISGAWITAGQLANLEPKIAMCGIASTIIVFTLIDFFYFLLGKHSLYLLLEK